MTSHKLIRITTVPISLGGLLTGQLKFMSNYFKVIGISSASGNTLSQVGKKENVKVIPVEMSRKITPINDLIATWKLFKIFKREKPHIVHTHTPKAGTLGMLAAYLAKVPHRLHTIAGLPLLEATGSKRVLLDIVEKITYACATKIYPNSFGLKNIIIENGYTIHEKIKVIGNGSSNGIDTSYFDPLLFTEENQNHLRASLGISRNDYVFIFLGRLVGDKGVNELIHAFDNISKKNPKTKLILGGKYEKELDPLNSKVEFIIENHPDIIAPGWLKDVRPYLSISNAMVFPSYREGFPNVVMQAGAMGIPIIASDINGCNEIVSHGINGYIIPPKNTLALERRMLELIENPQTFLQKVCRSTIVENYQQEFIWSELLKEYQNTLNKENFNCEKTNKA